MGNKGERALISGMDSVEKSTTPEPLQVRSQLEKIVSGDTFKLSKRLKTFLTFIVDAALEGHADRLKEYTLGIEVFEKDDGFDPSIDAIVRVEASRLRGKLREYYGSEGQDDSIRIEIPKGHYIPTFTFVKQNQELQNQSASESLAPSILAKIGLRKAGLKNAPWLPIGIVLTLAFGLLLLSKYESSSTSIAGSVPAQRSVAVLPFLPLSSGQDDEYFADGLTEEILNSLAQLPELHVTARTSSFFFKGKNLLVPDIAAQLGVAHVVEGSVRRQGTRLRISAQLIRASDDAHLWSQTYDRTHQDVFAVQFEIAEKIAEVLGVALDDNARATMQGIGIPNLDAFIAYQKGQAAFLQAHQGLNMAEALAMANTNFDRALEAAPDLTNARLMKADLSGHILFEITSGIRNEEVPGELQATLISLRNEYRSASQASSAGSQKDILDLESTLFSDDWHLLPARIGKAMTSGGCPQMNWTNAFISPFGWAGQMTTKFREAVACNPLDTGAYFQLAWALIWSGDPEGALRAIAEAESKGLSHQFLEDGRFWALLASGQLDDPRGQGPGPISGNMPYDRRILTTSLAGDSTAADQLVADYRSTQKTNDFSLLIISAVTGDRATANEMAARIDARPGSVVTLGTAISTCYCGAPFDLSSTPNYKTRIEEAGLSWPPLVRISYPEKNW